MKKLLAMALALCMLLVNVSFAENSEDTLKNVTLLVKQQLSVGDEFETFYGESYQYNNGITMWRLNWSDENNGSLNIQCTENGVITQYNRYLTNKTYMYYSDFAPVMPSVTREQVLRAANDFMQLVLREGEACTFAENSFSISAMGDDTVYLNGYLSMNGLETENSISLSLSVPDLSVRSYYRNDQQVIHILPADLPAAAQVAQQPSEETLKDMLSLTLKYVQEEENTAVLRYIPDDNGVWLVDALTGEAFQNSSSAAQYARNTSLAVKEASDAVAGSVQLTQAELAGAAVLKDVLSAEQLEGMLRKNTLLGITDSFAMESIQYTVNRETEQVMASVQFRMPVTKDMLVSQTGMEQAKALELENSGRAVYKTIELDAKQGFVYSIYTGYPGIYGEFEYQVNEEAAKPVAEEFLQQIIPEYFQNSVLTATNSEQNEESYRPFVSFDYTRVHDNIPFDGNSLHITIDSSNNTVHSFYYNWNDELTFAPSDNKITAEAALEAYKNHFYSKLYYANEYGQEYPYTQSYRLAYGLFEEEGILGIDAVTGEEVLYTYAVEDMPVKEYDDLSACQNAEIIGRLAEYGIGYEEHSVYPEQALTVRSMLQLLLSADGYNTAAMSYEQLIRTAQNRGIPVTEEMTAESLVTKADYAAMLIDMSGYGKAASIKNIYVCSFADAEDIPEDRFGHVAIAQGMGVAVADENGMFYPNAETTREEALVMLYQFMVRNV